MKECHIGEDDEVRTIKACLVLELGEDIIDILHEGVAADHSLGLPCRPGREDHKSGVALFKIPDDEFFMIISTLDVSGRWPVRDVSDLLRANPPNSSQCSGKEKLRPCLLENMINPLQWEPGFNENDLHSETHEPHDKTIEDGGRSQGDEHTVLVSETKPIGQTLGFSGEDFDVTKTQYSKAQIGDGHLLREAADVLTEKSNGVHAFAPFLIRTGYPPLGCRVRLMK